MNQEKIEKWEKEFFERFGANKIWVTPSRDNVETILCIKSFIQETLLSEKENLLKELGEKLESMKKETLPSRVKGMYVKDFLINRPTKEELEIVAENLQAESYNSALSQVQDIIKSLTNKKYD